MLYLITPTPAPRQSKSSAWSDKPVYVRWRAFCAEVRARGVKIPQNVGFVFYIPMPLSWSEKRRVLMHGQPHQQTPDLDNLVKGVIDAAMHGQGLDDKKIWRIRAQKRWSRNAAIRIDEGADAELI